MKLTPAARKKLTLYRYPGSVRKLRNVILRAAALCEGDCIDEEQITLADEHADLASPSASFISEDARKFADNGFLF